MSVNGSFTFDGRKNFELDFLPIFNSKKSRHLKKKFVFLKFENFEVM